MAELTQKERYYGLIQRPIMTEKSTVLQDLRGQYTFKVAPGANKSEIKKAVEALFDVKVAKINVINVPGKFRRILGRPGRSPGWRKALIQLQEGQSIDLA